MGEQDCRAVLRKVHEFLDEELAGTDRAEVAEHLELCFDCLEVVEFEMELKAAIAARCRDEAPGELLGRLRTLLEAESASAVVEQRTMEEQLEAAQLRLDLRGLVQCRKNLQAGIVQHPGAWLEGERRVDDLQRLAEAAVAHQAVDDDLLQALVARIVRELLDG